MRGENAVGVRRPSLDRAPVWLVAGGALVLSTMAVMLLATVGLRLLPSRDVPQVEVLAVEQVTLRPGEISLDVRNAGSETVHVAQIFVNDAYVDFEGGQSIPRLRADTVSFSHAWQTGQPYKVSMMTSTGAVIEHQIESAIETPTADATFLGRMAALGLSVGVVPVLLGMSLLPVLRRSGQRTIRAIIAFTIGVLTLLVVDASLEAIDLSARSSGAFGGAKIFVLSAGLSFLVLYAVDGWINHRSATRSDGRPPSQFSFLIALGIGLHNLGEGLVIGAAYAVGEFALGSLLVVGFALHNITEGVAIVSPMTDRRQSLQHLVGLGLLAGLPVMPGAVVGALVSNSELLLLCFGAGAGAILQVAVKLGPFARGEDGRLEASSALALAAGAAVVYLTGLLNVT